MKTSNFWKSVIAGAGCIASFASVPVLAGEFEVMNVTLTEEQHVLLNGYSQPAPANYDIHTLDAAPGSAVPLVSLHFTAETNLMKGNSLELGALYQSWSLDPLKAEIDRTELVGTITVQAPLQRAMDFSKSIREKVELCPEKIIDKMIIDGAVGFNYSW